MKRLNAFFADEAALRDILGEAYVRQTEINMEAQREAMARSFARSYSYFCVPFKVWRIVRPLKSWAIVRTMKAQCKLADEQMLREVAQYAGNAFLAREAEAMRAQVPLGSLFLDMPKELSDVRGMEQEMFQGIHEYDLRLWLVWS